MREIKSLYDALREAGRDHGIRPFGTYALNALRMDKAYKAWGSELTTEISLVEADMLRFARKGGEYIGDEVVEQKQRDGVDIRLVY